MPKLIDLSGQRFGELVVERLAEVKLKKRPAWICRCDCGATRVVRAEHLRCGDARSCGKHKTKLFITSLRISGRANRLYPRETDTHSRLYSVWRAMLWRCTDPKHEAFARYGGAGITVCPEWFSFKTFREWAVGSGYQDHLTIDRKNNLLGYHPSNCRWASAKEQARNRKTNISMTAFGEAKLLVDWAEDPRCQVSLETLRKRVVGGQPPEFAMSATERQARQRASVIREAKKRRRKTR